MEPATRSTGRCARRPARRVVAVIGGVASGALMLSCAPRQIIVERAPQAYYQTAFPLHDTSAELERIRRSVKRIHYSAEYRTYTFDAAAGVTDADDLSSPAILALASDTLDETESKAGTGAVLLRTHGRAALVTSQHVVHHPDMLVQYFDDAAPGRRPRRPRRVASASFRQGVRGDLPDHPSVGPFEVVASDSMTDVALIEARLRSGSDSSRFMPIAAATGDPRRLSWGSFVYVLGFPRGYALLTFAIVSDPNRDRNGGFLTNGLWNEGMSGGVVLAVRGETGRLEWIGIARGGAGAPETRIVPAVATIGEIELPRPYDGPLFVESILRLQYGITFSVPMNSIRDLVARNRAILSDRGYDVSRF
jgi:Trypsin-like peptidase domain